MEEPEKKELSSCDKKVPGETLEESVDCEGQVQMEGSFSEEFVGEGGACNNGKDVMVEVLGSDVYIDGVCTRGSDAELNEEVGAGGSVEGAEDLGKDVRPAGLGNGSQARFEGSQAVESEEPKSENVARATKLDAVALEILERGRAVVGSDKFDVSKPGESLLDNRAQKEVGNGASDSSSVVNTTSGKIEVSAMEEDVGVEDVNALDAGVRDCKLTSTRCDSAIGHSLTVSSIGRENVESKRAEKDNQQEIRSGDHGAKEDKNDVTLKTLDVQKKEVCFCDKVEFEETLNSDEEQPMGIDEVGDSSNCALRVIPGAEVAVDKSLLNSEEKSIEKDHMTDTSQVSSDTRQEMEVEDQPESIEIMNHAADIQDTRIADQGYFALVGAGREECHDKALLSADDQKSEFMKCAQQSVTGDATQVESNIKQKNVEEQAGISEQVGSLGGQETEVEEFNDADQRKTMDGKTIKRASMKPGSSGAFYQASYSLPAEKEGEFSVSDMVWGKVRSHPWWPGQIFDPSDASEKAMKHFKRDCYLVAYFGDRTFAWNEESQLKAFRTHFSSIEKQSTSESFHNAVECALDEVTRRVEFGLACCCIPKDTYDTIKFQTIENTGIRQELSFRDGVDESLNASSFSPDKLVEYLKTLSEFPTGDFDRLELVIAKAQLLAFYRLKGFSCLPELEYCGGLDNDLDSSIHDGEKNSSEVIEHAIPVSKNDSQAGTRNLKSQNSSRHKRKHNLKEGMCPTKKQRSLSELMGGTPDSPEGDYWSDEKVTDDLVFPSLSKKRRTIDHYDDSSGMQDGRKTISLAKVSNTTKQSFKIGECIRRVASQLTGSPSMLKCSGGDRSQKTDGSMDGFSGIGSDVSFQNIEEAQRSSSVVTTDYSSLDDLLCSLQWVAEEPLGDYSFLNAIVSFFSDFRNSIIVADDSWKEILSMDKAGTKRKKATIAGTPEAFEFEDMSDTYWTDRVIENGSEEQPSRRNRKKDYQHDPTEPEGTVKVSRRSNSRRRYSDSSHAEAPEKPTGYIDENSPAELVMNFAELDSVPSETSLNKMFKRFGPLKESETEVDRVSSRARVVFKKCADAEVACSSAKKFNIFGQILVNYQLNYTPSALFKASSVATTQDQEMHLDLANFEVNAV